MLDTESKNGFKTNSGCTCPSCHNADTNKMQEIKIEAHMSIRLSSGVNHAVNPILCEKCGTIFVKPYDLMQI